MSDRIGMCSECKEWTSIEDPCCNAGVWFEGSLEYPDADTEDLNKETPEEIKS